MRRTNASKNSGTRRKHSSSDRFKHLQRQSQTALRRKQDELWEKRADDIESTLPQGTQMFFCAIKEVYSSTKPRTTPLLSADASTLLKEKSSINARWREHFSTLLNRPSTMDLILLDQIPQNPVITSLDLPPTIDEVLKAVRQTSSGKFPQRSSSQPVQWPLKHSTQSSPASGMKRI